MKKKNIAKAAIGLAGVHVAFSGLLFKEAMSRDSKLLQKIYDATFVKSETDNLDGPGDEINNLIEERRKWVEAQPLEEFDMINSRGLLLKGYLLKAEKETKNYIFCSHGYRSSGIYEFGPISKFYHDKGYNVFWVDHQGNGKSEGKSTNFGYFESQDCLEWLNYMLENFGDDINIVIHGISMGSATVMMLDGFPELPKNVKFAIADCGYTSMNEQFLRVVKSVHVPGKAIIGTANMFNKAVFKFKFQDVNPLKSVSHAQTPILFIHGAKDGFVPTDMVFKLYNACSTPKDLLVVDGAGHAASYETNPYEYERKVTEFLDKYFETEAVEK